MCIGHVKFYIIIGRRGIFSFIYIIDFIFIMFFIMRSFVTGSFPVIGTDKVLLKAIHVHPFLYWVLVLVDHVQLMSMNWFEYQLQQKMHVHFHLY